VRRTAALIIAGYLLYIPANLLPVTTLQGVGGDEHHTIMSGVFELIHNDLWPLALIVFLASIVLPLVKLLSLTWMLIAVRRRSPTLLRTRTWLYRTIDAVGRWSNIDVFMGSVLAALLQFGALTTVRAQSGLVAFAAVVVITMIATATFDSRLMWDAAAEESAA
jgi:paraquat-inducible protein A